MDPWKYHFYIYIYKQSHLIVHLIPVHILYIINVYIILYIHIQSSHLIVHWIPVQPDTLTTIWTQQCIHCEWGHTMRGCVAWGWEGDTIYSIIYGLANLLNHAYYSVGVASISAANNGKSTWKPSNRNVSYLYERSTQAIDYIILLSSSSQSPGIVGVICTDKQGLSLAGV